MNNYQKNGKPENSKSIIQKKSINSKENKKTTNSEKGPLSFLSGALTSAMFAWLSFIISEKVIIYFSIHSKEFNSPIAQSVASGFKTLVIGMCFLATFTFTFIAIGLVIVFIRSLFDVKQKENE